MLNAFAGLMADLKQCHNLDLCRGLLIQEFSKTPMWTNMGSSVPLRRRLTFSHVYGTPFPSWSRAGLVGVMGYYCGFLSILLPFIVFAEPYDPPFSHITWPWEVQGNQSPKQDVFETGILEFQAQCTMARSDKLILHERDVDSNCENGELQECIVLGGCNCGIYTGQTSRRFGITVTRRGEKGICYRNRVAVIRPG